MQHTQLNYRPKPLKDEFYLSYLMRLSVGNGFMHWKIMVDALYYNDWLSSSTYDLIKLATGFDDEKLENISLYLEPYGGYSLFGKKPLKTRKVIRASTVKVCHACLQEGKYVRGSWQFVDVKHCILHGVPLDTISRDVFETKMQQKKDTSNHYQQMCLHFYDDEFEKTKEILKKELIERRSKSRGNTPKEKIYREIVEQINLSEILDKRTIQMFLPNVL